MPNEIDELMNLDPLDLSAQDIDAIVAFQRKARANFEAGVKPKKETGPKTKLDLTSMGLVKKLEPLKRRI
jgi:hypothetical protein